MFSSFNTTGSSYKKFAPQKPYFWNFNRNSIDTSNNTIVTSVTSDSEQGYATIILSNELALSSSTSTIEGDQCFNGGDYQYVGTSNNISINPSISGLTICLWFQTNRNISSTVKPPGITCLVGLGIGNDFNSNMMYVQFPSSRNISGGIRFECWVAGSYIRSSNENLTVADQNWHHFAVTWRGSTFKMYIDGSNVLTNKSDVSADGTAGVAPNVTYNRLGINHRGTGDNSSKGFFKIDCLRVFPSELTANQIQAYYTNGN